MNTTEGLTTGGIDISQSLRNTENSLRDFIASVLEKKLGGDWIEKSGVTPERIVKWKERKDVEGKRQETGVVEERLIYYADFYDLKTILKKHWDGEFSAALGELKSIEVYLSDLENLRDPDAHRRELLPHQKHLILGIEGEIRNRIIRYRSKQETQEDYFPRIESVRDSLGNIWTPTLSETDLKIVTTGLTLRPGDTIDYVITARDPDDGPLQYCVTKSLAPATWLDENAIRIIITDKDVAKNKYVKVFIRSLRPYHASAGFDDSVSFRYSILPVSRG